MNGTKISYFEREKIEIMSYFSSLCDKLGCAFWSSAWVLWSSSAVHRVVLKYTLTIKILGIQLGILLEFISQWSSRECMVIPPNNLKVMTNLAYVTEGVPS
jgi:hypothetical protein